ncbi:hypothetical protein IX51_01925 [uncultured archaeon]|nr:hypothetical protein IX51_01925 [uncultured archaeon]HKJ96595.1 hypothetical protein [Thermoplasmataceae archaeon]
MRDSGRKDELASALDLMNFAFLQTPENLEKLGKNSKPVKRKVSGKSEKEATFILLDLVRGLYSGDPLIGKFLRQVRKNRGRYSGTLKIQWSTGQTMLQSTISL